MSKQFADRGLELSPADAKPRLKWTRQLHQRFVDAVNQLGGADRATPKSVMRVMGIPEITLYHLKSHLQKYRLAQHRDQKKNKDEDSGTMENVFHPVVDEYKFHAQLNKSGTMLQLQMDVQRKLQEQIEVQRHLQIRIEAQGKYLQSVLRKAQESLAGYSLNPTERNAMTAELTAVDTEYPSCYFSLGGSAPQQQQLSSADCSKDSCLTCSDRPELQNMNCRKNQQQQHDSVETSDCSINCSVESSKMDQSHLISDKEETESIDILRGRERCRCPHQEEEGTVRPEDIDLNR